MTDTTIPTYTIAQPRLRVTATYAATDGAAPESIDVEIHDERIVNQQVISAIIDDLACVAGRYPATTMKATSPGTDLTDLTDVLHGGAR